MAELRVVVVLDDRRVVTLREVEERPPAGEAHRHSTRRLVRWRGVHDLDIGWDLVDHDALAVDRDGDHAEADRFEQQSDGWVSRILDRNGVAGTEHRARHEVDRLLCPRGHDDLILADHDPTRSSDPAGERGAQRRVARRVAVPRQGLVECRRGTSPPCVDGKQVRIGLSTAQVDAAGAWRFRGRRGRIDRERPEGRRTSFGRSSFRGRRTDGGSAPGVPHQVPLGDEQAVDGRHGVPRDAELVGQLARWWQRIARDEETRLDGVPDLVVDRTSGTASGGGIEVDLHRSPTDRVLAGSRALHRTQHHTGRGTVPLVSGVRLQFRMEADARLHQGLPHRRAGPRRRRGDGRARSCARDHLGQRAARAQLARCGHRRAVSSTSR